MGYSEGCAVCGEALDYTQEAAEKRCSCCGSTQHSNAECPMGHFVCDQCHRSSGFELIEEFCGQSPATDPLEMAVRLMKNPVIKMHGPEHHYLVPAVLIAAYYNFLGDKGTKVKKLAIARKRSESVPGGYCGTHGSCGAGIGAGIFVSAITGATPLSETEWAAGNRITGEALVEIAMHGGPRCCKRDSFLVIGKGLDYLEKNMDMALPHEKVMCEFSHRNQQCRLNDCLYFAS